MFKKLYELFSKNTPKTTNTRDQNESALLSVINMCMQYQSQAIKDYKNQIVHWLEMQIKLPGSIHVRAKEIAKSFEKYC